MVILKMKIDEDCFIVYHTKHSLNVKASGNSAKKHVFSIPLVTTTWVAPPPSSGKWRAFASQIITVDAETWKGVRMHRLVSNISVSPKKTLLTNLAYGSSACLDLQACIHLTAGLFRFLHRAHFCLTQYMHIKSYQHSITR